VRGLLRGPRLAARARPAQRLALPIGTSQTASIPKSLARLPRLELADGLVLHTASTTRSRLRGLLGVDAVPPGHGLLITRTRSVHTVGMRTALDLVWLGADGGVVRVDYAVGPRRNASCRGARSVIETGPGDGDRFAVLAREVRVAILTNY